jgi:long-chain acyl-CoA synthetase
MPPMPANLSELVTAAAAQAPERAALVQGSRETSWSQLDREVDACAAALAARGLEPGDRVALVLGNVPELVIGYFGALRAGLVAVPVSTALTAPELAGLLTDSGARAALCSRSAAELLSSVRGTLSDLGLVVVADLPGVAADDVLPFDALLREGEALGRPAVRGGGEDLAVLLFTSGTSGSPRGAMLSHRALLANLDQCAAVDPPPVTSEDVVLAVLPFAHVYGLNATLGMVAKMAATAVLVERFDPVDTLAEVRRHKVTAVPGAPPLWLAWSLLPDVGQALGDLRLAVSGSAPLPADVLARLLERTGHPVYEGYGLTETAPVLTTTLCSDRVKPGSVGKPIPGVELRLVEGRPGDIGEISVRGPNLFSGYWPDGSEGPDEDGWFATGDLGYYDEDGDLFIAGRSKELILVSGFNVYPREVEEVLLAHPDVAEAVVVPIPHPYTGESVKAFLVLRPGAELGADDVVAHCARRLARFKCPTAVEIVTELPHTTTGKVAKGSLTPPRES